MTVVHTPLDARIHHRQVRALLDAGHQVTYAAPFSGHAVAFEQVDPRLDTVDLPRAVGRRRGRALRAAVRLLGDDRHAHDAVLVHDPELLLAVGLARPDARVIWDVHEDLRGSLDDKPWLPGPARPLADHAVRLVERWAERRFALLLAEEGYRERFRAHHPVVPNYPPLPARAPSAPSSDRIVYLGRVSRLRGAEELVEVGRRLAPSGITLRVVGSVDHDVISRMRSAHDRGWLEMVGFVPNAKALEMLDGSLAGLSLLHDHPNYRHSLPTKVLEYQAAGVPVITTPLPAAVEIVETGGSGVVVPFGDVDAVVDAVRRLRSDPGLAAALGRAGRLDAETGRSWQAVEQRFVDAVTSGGRRA